MSKKIKTMLLVFLLVCTLFNSGAAASSSYITLEPSNLEFNAAGDTVTTRVVFSNIPDFYAFDIEITYDPEIAEVISLKEGSAFEGKDSFKVKEEFNNNEGFVHIAKTLLGDDALSSGGELAVITFRAKAAGSSTININSSEIIVLTDGSPDYFNDDKVSDAEKVAAAKANLDLGDLSAVTEDLTLPETQDGAAVTWASNNIEIITNDGKVTRPAAGQPDAIVTLTATITVGEASDTKDFTATVKAMELITFTVIFEVTPEDAAIVVKDTKGEPATAEADGTYQLEAGNYTYTVTKEGYKDAAGTFTVTDKDKIVTVTLEEIEINPTIVSVAPVDDIIVDFGTNETEAIAALAQKTTIKDSNDVSHEVTLSWTIAGYDSSTAGDYTATGTFELPEKVDQADPAVELKVTATVTVEKEQSVKASLMLTPKTLHIRSQGKWVKARLTLPAGYDCREVDTDSIRLQCDGKSITPEQVKITGNGLLIEFNRSKAAELVSSSGTFTLNLTCRAGSRFFEAEDSINFITSPGKK